MAYSLTYDQLSKRGGQICIEVMRSLCCQVVRVGNWLFGGLADWWFGELLVGGIILRLGVL